MDITIRGQANLAKTGQDLVQARDRVRELIGKACNGFANRATTTIKEKYLTGGGDHLNVVTNRLRSSIRFLIQEGQDDVTMTFGSDVPYAAIHEFGGPVQTRVTPKMRGWAWAMFYKTGDSKFRAMALMKKDVIRRTMKARPFLSPGVEDEAPKLEMEILDVLDRAVEGSWNGQ